jgi:predicted RNase H-related nuclease YkuK (DUF458 family)
MSKRLNKDYFKELRAKSSLLYDSVPSLNWGEMIEGKYVISDRYHFVWKTEQGEHKHLTKIDGDVRDYILDFIKKEKEKQATTKIEREVSIFFGTDSQNYLSYTRFVSVIVLYVNRNGAHVLVSKFDLPKMYDYRYRLLKETDITAEVVRNFKPFLKENKITYEVHSDYNQSLQYKSAGVVQEATNYMKHLGFELKIKDASFAATYAADHFCK